MGDPYRTAPPIASKLPSGWRACDRCQAAMHPLNNCRRVGNQIICMPCSEKR